MYTRLKISASYGLLTQPFLKFLVSIMSWIVDTPLSWFQNLCINILKTGPIPRHLAIIMDGNRRYAKKAKVEKSEGHLHGFNKLSETLGWCLNLGIMEVTVYAFSIENFKRSQDEVDTLMQLAQEKFEILLNDKEKIMSEGVCVRIIGNLDLLPMKLRRLIAEVVLMTMDNKRAFLNIAFAYTSRDELTTSINQIIESINDNIINLDDVNEELITKSLYTNNSPQPDIIIRTSGEVRFSDFLLWQISCSKICFTKVLWPEFNLWHLLWCIFQYQRAYDDLNNYKTYEKSLIGNNKPDNNRIDLFVEKLQEKRLKQLRGYL